jgi:hypothetical protein
MKEENNKKLNLNDLNKSNLNPLDLSSSSEHNVTQSYLSNSDDKNPIFNKPISYIKFSINEEKHGYKYYHQQILSNQDIAPEIKNLYFTFYEDIEEKLNQIRTTKNSKKSIKEKLTPNFWSTQDAESQKIIDSLLQEIQDLVKNAEKLKNSLVLLQSIILKNLEKTKAILNKSENLLENYIIDVTNRNSDSYEILKFLKEIKYQQIINNVEKFQSLDNGIKLQFLEYLASDLNDKEVANNLFGQNFNLRIDIFNHYIDNDFWIDIYSNEENQKYAENFYEAYGRDNYNLFPKIPFWGIVILSINRELANNDIVSIVNHFLQPNIANVINDAGALIDGYQNDTQISENNYNLISNLSNYLIYAEPINEDQKAADSVKKIIAFQSSYNNTNGITENFSTIHPSFNKAYISDNAYEYYLHKGTINNPLLQYDVLYRYSNDTKKLTTNTYEYIYADKKPSKEKIEEKKLDDKKNEKNVNKDGNNESKENSITAFIKGGVTVLTAELIFFILWSAYFYWHQRSVIKKLIEKINKDSNELLHKELPVLILQSKKVKNIFDNFYDEDDENNEESEEEDDFDNDEKLIIDTPIYGNKIKSYNIVDTLKVPKEIIATPFSLTNIFILLNSEYFTTYTSECDSLKTNNNNIDLLEL